jgi:hypothetical protein
LVASTTDFARTTPEAVSSSQPSLLLDQSCHRCTRVNARARSVGGPRQPPHIAHRIDGPGTGIKEPAMKRAGTDLFRRLLPRQQPDRRAKPDPFLGAPRQILEPRLRMRGVNGAGPGQFTADLVPFDQRHHVARPLAQNIHQSPTALAAKPGPHILRR